jgi:hypothetical protein
MVHAAPLRGKRHHRSSSLSLDLFGCVWMELRLLVADPHRSRRGACGGHPDLPSCPTSCSVMRTRRRCRRDMAAGLWWYASASDVVLPRREAEPLMLLLASPSVTTSRRRVSPRWHHMPLTSAARACAGGGGQARWPAPSGGGWWARTTGQGPMRTCPAEVGLDPRDMGDGGRR